MRAVSRRALRTTVRTLTCGCAIAALPVGAAHAITLPDGRGYEKVTPAYKGDGDMVTSSGNPTAWPGVTGERLIFQAATAFADTGSSFSNQYVAERASSGWQTTSVTPASAAGDYWYVQGQVSPNLARLGLLATQGDTLAPPRVPQLFVTGAPGGPYTTMLTAPMGVHGENRVVGMSDDGSHVVLRVDAATASAPASSQVAGAALYEWVDGTLRLINVQDDGTLVSQCGADLGNGVTSSDKALINTVSGDGSRIFFESPDPQLMDNDPACNEVARLYVRENGTKTIEVSAPAAGISSTPERVSYVGAAADGSKVFFRVQQQLTPDAAASPSGKELYEYDLDDHQLRRISGGETGVDDAHVRFAIVSNDGSAVYFTANAQLVAGKGTVGQPNLYRYDTVDHSYRYIATLSIQDVDAIEGDNLFGAVSAFPSAQINWYVTPDGSTVLFGSRAALTADSPTDGAGNVELYRFSDKSGDLSCVSCPPSGTTSGWAQFTNPQGSGIQANISRYNRPLSEDGSMAFFDTPDALLPTDVNGKRDVYEWHDGKLSLITSGTDVSDSFFVGSSQNGRDLFVGTHERLLSSDHDNVTDIYDARVGGGFPELSSPEPCQGDACQAPPGSPPSIPAASSSTAFDTGNLVPGPVIPGRSFSVKRISTAQLRTLARTGRLTLTVTTSTSGRVTAVASAALRGHKTTVARSSRVAQRKGALHVTLRLSDSARATLARRHRLRVGIRVTFAGVSRAKTASITLKVKGGRR